jgi:hypothetical protein
MANPAEKKQEAWFEKEAIFEILTHITKKWQKQSTPAKEDMADSMIPRSKGAKKEVTPKYEVVETVVLSPKGVEEGFPVKEELTKTIILSSESVKKESFRSPFHHDQEIGNTTETVVISPRAAIPSTSPPGSPAKDHGVPREKESLKGGGKPRREKTPEDAEEEFLPETIVLNTKMLEDKKGTKE